VSAYGSFMGLQREAGLEDTLFELDVLSRAQPSVSHASTLSICPLLLSTCRSYQQLLAGVLFV
jgi:hypothetical protein